MNSKIAILLTILFVSVGLRDVFTIAYFFSNQTYIAKNLCINKDKPNKKCRGKCYLAKQLKEKKEKNNQEIPLNRLFDHFELKILPNEEVSETAITLEIEKEVHWTFESNLYQSGYYSAPFHPPEIIS